MLVKSGGEAILPGDEPIPQTGTAVPGTSAQKEQARGRLHQFLSENLPLLLGIIRSHVLHTGLAHGEAVNGLAADVFQDAVFEALTHVERFDPATSPRAWFMGIVLNILKRKRAEAARRSLREVAMSDLFAHLAINDECDFFDQISALIQPGPEYSVEANEQVVEMLSLVSEAEQHLLRLAFLHDLNTYALAQALHITPGAARVRLHRAIQRLRIAWKTQAASEEGRTTHG